MIYLSGAVRPEVLGQPNLGVMLTPNMGNRPDLSTAWWAADTGLFSKTAEFDLARYLAWLVGMQPYRATCLFCTAPDVIPMHLADPEEAGRRTLERSRYVLPVIRALGFPAALIAQNGIEQCEIPWETFDALFIGGNDAFKFSPYVAELLHQANARGVARRHMGRTNSERRLRYARRIGCTSADGTYIKFGPDINIVKVQRWMRRLEATPQRDLWGASA